MSKIREPSLNFSYKTFPSTKKSARVVQTPGFKAASAGAAVAWEDVAFTGATRARSHRHRAIARVATPPVDRVRYIAGLRRHARRASVGAPARSSVLRVVPAAALGLGDERVDPPLCTADAERARVSLQWGGTFSWKRSLARTLASSRESASIAHRSDSTPVMPTIGTAHFGRETCANSGRARSWRNTQSSSPRLRTSMRMRLCATMRQISAQPKRASIPERHRSAIPAIMALSDGEGICVSSRARARARARSRGHISQGPHEAGAALPSRTNGRARALTLAMQSLQDCS